MSKAGERLRKAGAQILRGWTQGALTSPKPRRFLKPGIPSVVVEGQRRKYVCLLGSLHSVAEREYHILERLIPYDGPIAIWNDEPGRTAIEVAHLLERAAQWADLEEK